MLLLFMVLISLVPVLNLLYFYISTFCSVCAVPNMAVFCSSSTSCFPAMLLTYFLNDFEIVLVAPIISGITLLLLLLVVVVVVVVPLQSDRFFCEVRTELLCIIETIGRPKANMTAKFKLSARVPNNKIWARVPSP